MSFFKKVLGGGSASPSGAGKPAAAEKAPAPAAPAVSAAPAGGNDAAGFPLPPEPGSPPEVTPADVRRFAGGANPPVLLDVREVYELQSTGFIPGALHIPMNSVPERLGELPRDRPVIVYCAHGMRSYNVAAYLLENGFSKVASLQGGIAMWDGEVARHTR